MILGFDIGNTSTLMGVYTDGSVVPFETFRYATEKTSFEYDLWEHICSFVDDISRQLSESVSGFAYSSVVPEMNSVYDELALNRFGIRALCISHKSLLSIRIMYADPSMLGVDRIVNAEAVHREYGGDNIIVDIGTAATICVLMADGTFEGGIIAPGIGTTINALAQNTSRLPAVVFEEPDRLVARDTINALKSGFFYGWISLLQGMIARIEKDYGKSFRIIFTGGLADKIAFSIERPVVLDRFLTMKGIKYIYDKNRER